MKCLSSYQYYKKNNEKGHSNQHDENSRKKSSDNGVTVIQVSAEVRVISIISPNQFNTTKKQLKILKQNIPHIGISSLTLATVTYFSDKWTPLNF